MIHRQIFGGTVSATNHRSAVRPSLVSLVAAVALSLGATSTSASPSPSGCADVNSGSFNIALAATTGVKAAISGFNVGDTIHFTVTGNGNSSDFELLNGALNTALLTVSLTNSPQQANYTVTGNSGDTSLAEFFAIYQGGATLTVVATCVPASTKSSDASQTVTKGFLLSRINGILLNDPGSTSLLNRSNSTVPGGIASAGIGATNIASSAATFGGAMGLGAGLANRHGDRTGIGASRFDDADASTDGSRNIQFSNSLSKMRREAANAQMSKDRMALGAGDGGSLPLAYATASPWDVWVEGRYSAFDDDALDRDGHVGVLYVGTDYRLTENLIVGALIQFDWSKDQSGVLQSDIDGTGWMAGPYLSARIHDNVYLDLRAAWGGSSNDMTLGATTGTFDTTRWLVKGTLAGNFEHAAWRITPSAELAYVEENQNVFTNSAGTFVPSQTVSLGRLQFGPEFGYRFAHTADTFIEPFAAIRGVWDFDNPNVAIIDGFVVGPGDFWGRLEGGLNVMTSGGTYVRGSASWDGVGASDYSGYTLQGTVNVPLN